jgi:hypothetical protein
MTEQDSSSVRRPLVDVDAALLARLIVDRKLVAGASRHRRELLVGKLTRGLGRQDQIHFGGGVLDHLDGNPGRHRNSFAGKGCMRIRQEPGLERRIAPRFGDHLALARRLLGRFALVHRCLLPIERQTLLQELALGEAVERAAARHQFVAGAGLDDSSTVEHEDAVGVADRAEAVGDDDARGGHREKGLAANSLTRTSTRLPVGTSILRVRFDFSAPRVSAFPFPVMRRRVSTQVNMTRALIEPPQRSNVPRQGSMR